MYCNQLTCANKSPCPDHVRNICLFTETRVSIINQLIDVIQAHIRIEKIPERKTDLRKVLKHLYYLSKSYPYYCSITLSATVTYKVPRFIRELLSEQGFDVNLT